MELVDSIATRRAAVAERPTRQAAAPSVPPVADVSEPESNDEGMLRSHEGEHTVWRVQCGDMINRGRCITVYVDSGEVVLACPPGETARLSPDQLDRLRVALHEANTLAERYR
ncbi:hypothetical protein [Haloechinothrix sp. LS1_15]|uniref:hypothetical protein n=1 Tax=Haloechinothrix sp. LS1_15 TaxID=2652248 RepID=UPI00294588B7|nr:hypothetical protein [Haloechinothrix sp. LS1_15]MDV6010889.1 hypothetical protein [Haloechinothrix sp. LS1_15]